MFTVFARSSAVPADMISVTPFTPTNDWFVWLVSIIVFVSFIELETNEFVMMILFVRAFDIVVVFIVERVVFVDVEFSVVLAEELPDDELVDVVVVVLVVTSIEVVAELVDELGVELTDSEMVVLAVIDELALELLELDEDDEEVVVDEVVVIMLEVLVLFIVVDVAFVMLKVRSFKAVGAALPCVVATTSITAKIRRVMAAFIPSALLDIIDGFFTGLLTLPKLIVPLSWPLFCIYSSSPNLMS